MLPSPYRSVVGPLVEYIDRFVDEQDHYVTVVIPEFVPRRLWQHLLHNQTAWILRFSLRYSRPGWRGRFRIINDVPFYLSH